MTEIQKRILYPFGFFLFISYIIFLADTADLNYGLEIVRIIPYGDKFFHALLYGMMAMFLNYGLGFRRVYGVQLGAILVLIFATIEEISQMFISTRTFDLGDLAADLIGVILFSIRSKV
jgi:VanZ family protein